MYVFIDNTKTEQNVFFVSKDNKEWKKIVSNESGEGSLERSFEELLKNEKLTYKQLSGIAVRVGEGRFTATRIATTFANMLASTLKIPVAAVWGEDPGKAGNALKNTKIGVLVSAKYSAEPRVGGK